MKNKIARIIALLVVILAIFVMFGWFFDVTFLKSISPNWVSMKFITAICFVLSGVVLYLSSEKNGTLHDWKDLLLAYTDYVLLLIVSGLGLSIFFGTSTGLEELFVREPPGAFYTSLPGRPALFTLIAFLLVGAGGLFTLIGKHYCRRLPIIEGGLLILIGSVATTGYVINFPPFFYKFSIDSTAMALHTAILFILLGIGFLSIRD